MPVGPRGLAALGIIVAPAGGMKAATEEFISAIAHHRFFGRPDLESISA